MRDQDFEIQIKSLRSPPTEAVRVDGAGRALLARGQWWIGRDGYVKGRLAGRLVTLHRELCRVELAGTEDKRHVDHLNGNRTDCRVCNLEVVDVGTNQRRRETKRGASGVKGVSKTARGWRARVYRGSRAIELGTYRTIGRAAEAVARWERRCGK